MSFLKIARLSRIAARQSAALLTRRCESTTSQTSSTIDIQQFAAVELVVGEIKSAVKVEKSNKLLKLHVDLGPKYGVRTILSGVADHFSPEQLVGKQGVFVANLAPRKMMGLESQGMMLFGKEEGTGKMAMVTLSPEKLANGTRIT